VIATDGTPAVTPGAPAVLPGQPGITARTARFSVNLTGAVAAGLALQVWIVALLGAEGPHALYVRSIYTPIGFLVLAVAEGLSVVVQVNVGHATRAGRPAAALGVLRVCIPVGVGFFVLLAGVMTLAGDQITAAVGVAPGERSGVTGFIALMCLANALAVVPVLCSAMLRGTGRSGVSALLTTANALGSGLLMYALVTLVHAGPDSVPFGYLAMTAVTSLAAIILVGRTPGRGRWRDVPLPMRQVARDLSSTALPVAGSFLLLSLSSAGYLSLLHHRPAAEVTGFSLGLVLQTYLIVPATAIGTGAAIAATLARDGDWTARRRRGMRALLAVAAPAYLVIAIVMSVAHSWLVDVFTGDPVVREAAAHYLGTVAPTFALLGITVAVLTFLEQVGFARSAFLLNVTFFAAVLAVAALLGHPPRASLIAGVIAVANLCGFTGVLVSAARLLRRPAPGGKKDEK
jgi:Na+-driven multidrug efflux pump